MCRQTLNTNPELASLACESGLRGLCSRTLLSVDSFTYGFSLGAVLQLKFQNNSYRQLLLLQTFCNFFHVV